jgi:large subunit ribosomal protein L18
MKNFLKQKRNKAHARKRRVRARVFGTKERPRLSVKRSLRSIQAQLIDDQVSKTLTAEGDHALDRSEKPVVRARRVGESLGKKALALGIKEMVVDRGPYKFHGRIQALIEGCVAEGVTISRKQKEHV